MLSDSDNVFSEENSDIGARVAQYLSQIGAKGDDEVTEKELNSWLR